MNDTDERVADFMPFRTWVTECGGKLFPTFSSAEWFIRLYRNRLVKSGQLIVRRGSSGSLVGPRFDAVVLEILREESCRAVAALDAEPSQLAAA